LVRIERWLDVGTGHPERQRTCALPCRCAPSLKEWAAGDVHGGGEASGE
jgi:hypothetical protein